MLGKVKLVIDSGVGGLTFIEEAVKQGLKGNFFYVGDTKNSPYGNKTPEYIKKSLSKIVDDVLEKYEIEEIILACNTAAVTGQGFLVEKYGLKVRSVVDVTLKKFNNINSAKIDWLATPTTIGTNYIKDKLYMHQVKGIPCKEFVPLIESEAYNKSLNRENVVKNVLEKEGRTEDAEYVILGCTHYPYLEKEIRNEYSDGAEFFNPSVDLVKEMLNEQQSNECAYTFNQTGNSTFFKKFVKEKLGAKVGNL